MNAVEKKSLRRVAAIQILAGLAPLTAVAGFERITRESVKLATQLVDELARVEDAEAALAQTPAAAPPEAASVQPVTP